MSFLSNKTKFKKPLKLVSRKSLRSARWSLRVSLGFDQPMNRKHARRVARRIAALIRTKRRYRRHFAQRHAWLEFLLRKAASTHVRGFYPTTAFTKKQRKLFWQCNVRSAQLAVVQQQGRLSRHLLHRRFLVNHTQPRGRSQRLYLTRRRRRGVSRNNWRANKDRTVQPLQLRRVYRIYRTQYGFSSHRRAVRYRSRRVNRKTRRRYAGLFGKRRWRTERRDKQLTTRRFSKGLWLKRRVGRPRATYRANYRNRIAARALTRQITGRLYTAKAAPDLQARSGRTRVFPHVFSRLVLRRLFRAKTRTASVAQQRSPLQQYRRRLLRGQRAQRRRLDVEDSRRRTSAIPYRSPAYVVRRGQQRTARLVRIRVKSRISWEKRKRRSRTSRRLRPLKPQTRRQQLPVFNTRRWRLRRLSRQEGQLFFTKHAVLPATERAARLVARGARTQATKAQLLHSRKPKLRLRRPTQLLRASFVPYTQNLFTTTRASASMSRATLLPLQYSLVKGTIVRKDARPVFRRHKQRTKSNRRKGSPLFIYRARVPRSSKLQLRSFYSPLALKTIDPLRTRLIALPTPSRRPLAASTYARPNFLSRMRLSWPRHFPKASARLAAERLSRVQLLARQHRRNARRFTRSRTLARMAMLRLSRQRKRRGGAGLFVRHSLKRPRTSAGKRKLLFPPVKAYAHATAVSSWGGRVTNASFVQPTRRVDERPRFWIRPPNAINRWRQKYFISLAHFRLRRRGTHVTRRRFPKKTTEADVHPLTAAPITHEGRLRALSTSSSTLPASTSVASPAQYQLQLQRSGYDEFISRGLVEEPRGYLKSLSAMKARRAVLRENRRPARAAKVNGLWHARSVRNMRTAERKLSAWTPQYQLKWRRWGSPRIHGHVKRQGTLSVQVRRLRAQINQIRYNRGLPEYRYLDHSFAHLRFNRGSVLSVGYARFRRVYRGGHSNHNRWWKSIVQAAPFAHPHSRRALNLVKYHPRRVRAFRDTVLRNQRTEETAPFIRYPVKRVPRLIPWRNFKFPQPKWKKAPTILQRWSFGRAVNRTSLRKQRRRSSLVYARPLRHIRKLERLFPKANIWVGRRWEALDATTASTIETRHCMQILSKVPGTIWAALQRKAGTLSRYAAIRSRIINTFHRWGEKTLAVTVSSELRAKQQEALARNFLTALIRTELTAAACVRGVQAEPTHTVALRRTALYRRAAFKQNRYWQLRQMPVLRRSARGETMDPLDRANSTLYRRWLHGAKRFLKLSQSSPSQPVQSRYLKAFATSVGRRRARFPGSGRRRGSYDSLLHAFAKRTGPSRFRRSSAVRFKRARFLRTGDFRRNLRLSLAGRRLRQHRALAQQLGRVSYLSATWRELLAYRLASPRPLPTKPYYELTSIPPVNCVSVLKAGEHFPLHYGQPFGSAVKHRFASLPINAAFKRAARTVRQIRPVGAIALRAARAGLLRRALRRRRNERVFVDLKKWARRRRLPKDQRPQPWKARKRALRRSRYHHRDGNWSNWASRKHKEPTPIWTMYNASVRCTNVDNIARRRQLTYPTGEVLQLPYRAFKKSKRAKRGFFIRTTVRTKRIQRRKRQRNSLLRRRRYRRNPSKLRTRYYKHWSERKEIARAFRLYGRNVAVGARLAVRLRRKVNLRNSAVSTAAVAAMQVRLSSVARKNSSWMSAAARVLNSKAAVSANTLYRFTPLKRRPGRSRILRRHRRAGRLSKAAAAAYVRLHKRSHRRTRKLPAHLARSADNLGRRFVAEAPLLSIVSPLTFQRPTRYVVETEASKKRAFIANVSTKETRYKTTAQYVESLTAFIPELVSHIVSKKIKAAKATSTLTYSTVKHMIRNVYWSLRVYLNIDPFISRLLLRDDSHFTLLSIRDDIDELAKGQVTEQPQRAALRRRFVPGYLHRSPRTDRYRSDWLRQYLPAMHSLYQEDPREYGNLLFSTRKLRRLAAGPRGIASWETYRVRTSHETRARQLITFRYTRSRLRVETVLQGTRRLAAVEPAPIVAKSEYVREYFFRREFSTRTYRQTSGVTRWIYRQRRFVEFGGEDHPTTPYLLSSGRYRVHARVESRGRTNFSADPDEVMSFSGLDARFFRYKSPRSRQYILRAPAGAVHSSKQERITKLLAYHALRQRFAAKQVQAAGPWIRSKRRFSFNGYVPAVIDPTLDALRKTRRDTLFRRPAVALLLRRDAAKQQLIREENANFFSSVKNLSTNWLSRQNPRIARRATHYRAVGGLRGLQFRRSLLDRQRDSRFNISADRSVLQFRRAAHRSPKVQYAPRLVIDTTVIRAARLAPTLGREKLRLQQLKAAAAKLRRRLQITDPQARGVRRGRFAFIQRQGLMQKLRARFTGVTLQTRRKIINTTNKFLQYRRFVRREGRKNLWEVRRYRSHQAYLKRKARRERKARLALRIARLRARQELKMQKQLPTRVNKSVGKRPASKRIAPAKKSQKHNKLKKRKAVKRVKHATRGKVLPLRRRIKGASGTKKGGFAWKIVAKVKRRRFFPRRARQYRKLRVKIRRRKKPNRILGKQRYSWVGFRRHSILTRKWNRLVYHPLRQQYARGSGARRARRIQRRFVRYVKKRRLRGRTVVGQRASLVRRSRLRSSKTFSTELPARRTTLTPRCTRLVGGYLSLRGGSTGPVVPRRRQIARLRRVAYENRHERRFRYSGIFRHKGSYKLRQGYFRVRGRTYAGGLFQMKKDNRRYNLGPRTAKFDEYRTKLWDMLTLRWRKKERHVRNWVKEVGRWLRDPWLHEIVGLQPKVAKPDRFGGEFPAIEQLPGEYVPEVDYLGRDIPQARAAHREREEFVARKVPIPSPRDIILSGPDAVAINARRRRISAHVRAKPIPSARLANREFKQAVKEAAAEISRTPQQVAEENAAKEKKEWARIKAKLPAEKPMRPAFKYPADWWLPGQIWRDTRREVRKFEWRESDEEFFRKGFRNAFRFYQAERYRAPWLEALMYNRATYSTRLKEFRRRQFPREQKKYKWLQRVRKSLFPARTNRYIKGRRWHQLKTYNQKLHYSLFNLHDRRAASRHFRKLDQRTRHGISNFVHLQTGLGDRLDVTLMHLNIAPSIYWARMVAPFGLLRVNGVIQYRPDYQLLPGDLVQIEYNTVQRFQHYFKPTLNAREAAQRLRRWSSTAYPTNFEYHRGTRAMLYRHAPEEHDLRKSNRLQAHLFRWFKLDSV